MFILLRLQRIQGSLCSRLSRSAAFPRRDTRVLRKIRISTYIGKNPSASVVLRINLTGGMYAFPVILFDQCWNRRKIPATMAK
jgi:hypothetical protein